MSNLLGVVAIVVLIVGVVLTGIMSEEGIRSLSPEAIKNRAISLCLENDDWDWEVCEAVADRSIPERLATRHPSWQVEELKAVADGGIQLGMTTEMVLESWGWPGDVDRFVSEWESSESWTYHGRWSLTDYGGRRNYRSANWILNFDDGILTSYSEF